MAFRHRERRPGHSGRPGRAAELLALGLSGAATLGAAAPHQEEFNNRNAPIYEVNGMARAQHERGAKQAPAEDGRITLLRDLEAPGFMPPLSSMSTQDVARSAVQLFETLKIMQSDPEELGADDRRVYDQVSSLYGGDAAAARSGIVGHINSALAQLRSLAIQFERESRQPGHFSVPDFRQEVGEEVAAELDTYLAGVQGVLLDPESGLYTEYSPLAEVVPTAHILLQHGILPPGLTEAAELGEAPGTRGMPVALPDLSTYRLVSDTGGRQFYVVPPRPNDETIMLYGGEETATNALGAYSEGIAFLRNYPNQATSQEARDIAGRIYNAFAGFLGSDMGSDPAFAEAMRLFNEGDLSGGLDALRGVSWLNGTRSLLNNIYSVEVSDHAITVARLEARVVFEWGTNYRDFQDFIKRYSGEEASQREFDPILLYTAIGLAYDYLQVGAMYQWMQVSEAGELVTRGEPIGVRGEAHAASITSAWGIGSFVAGEPLETVVHVTGRYTYLDAGANVVMPDGTTRRVGPDPSHSFSIDVIGVEFRLPGREGERNIFRLERAGVGLIPDPNNPIQNVPGANIYAQTSLLWEGVGTPTLSIQSYFTAGFAYFLHTGLLTAEVEPATFTYQGETWNIVVGPYMRVEQEFPDDFSRVGVTRLEPGVRARFPLIPSSNVFEISIRAGASVEVGGSESERAPAAAQILVTPQLNFKTVNPYEKPPVEEPEVRLRARPRKTEGER